MLGSVSNVDFCLARVCMPQCPVCKVRYVKGKTECCPVCSWTVQPLTVLTGLIPEVAEREAVRLQWAKALWNRLHSQQEKFHQLQLQCQETVEQVQDIQNQLTQVNQEKIALTDTLRQQEITIANLQASLQRQVEQAHQAQAQPVSVELAAAEPATGMPEARESNAGELAIGESQSGQPESKELESEVVNISTPDFKSLETEPDTQDPLLQPTPQVKFPAQVSSMNSSILETITPQDLIFPIEPPAPDRRLMQKTSAIEALPLSPIAVQEFEFNVVTIQPQGLERQRHKAFCFYEPLETDISLEMVLVPGGICWMGSPESEEERDSNESPQHQVTLDSFFLSKFPITQHQWRAIATLPKIQRSLGPYPSNFESDCHPVEQVSWYDAIEFCARLSQKTGQLYRLPSEAEWEYACRAGTTTPFHFGCTLKPELANYDGNHVYGKGLQGIYRQATTAVGTFQGANAFGLFDMHGNVWEWCADPWHENYQNAPTDGSPWQSDEGATYQVLRGGAWYCLPGLCRSAQRHWNQPDGSGSGIGFRVVCQLPLDLEH
jgi:formylglycine-generating enzyme required for sulfatase activity